LQWITIGWNSVEVFITIGLGAISGSLALVAFGLDSLVEVFASLVVLWQLTPVGDGRHLHRERRAMSLVALAFAVLAAYLLVASARALWTGPQPDSSWLGVAYLAMTAAVMFGLAWRKRRLASQLDSGVMAAEASMTFLDGCLSTSVLLALVVNAWWGWWWADPLTALVVAAAAAREGREAWAHARLLGPGAG
jgi:divalent metal cation (Fe/Co/Zn/Cd) transporter